MLIVDAHLDLAYNAVRGRPVERPAAEQPPDGDAIASVGFPDLRAGGVRLICATIFCQPAIEGEAGYRTAAEAAEMARQQRNWYEQQIQLGRLRFARSPNDLPSPARAAAADEPLAALLLLEGADAIESDVDVAQWFDAGLRIVGLAWKRTRFAGGTRAPGPLTAAGIELVKALDRHRIIHDTSHLAEESFWQLLDLSPGPVMASHSNCRDIVPTDRQLSEAMIRALVQRGGVIGLNFYDKFLIPPSEYGTRRATLADLIAHVRTICDIAGSARHVGIGTDMDGGLGRDQLPREIRTSADLPRVAEALSSTGLSDAEVRGVMGENWLRFFRTYLPS